MIKSTNIGELRPVDFFAAVRPQDTGNWAPCAALSDHEGKPNRQRWTKGGVHANAALESYTMNQVGAYFTPATFSPDVEGRHKRSKLLVQAVRAVWIDVEGTEAKGGYEGQKATLTALRKFSCATLMVPTITLLTGSGGLHAYYAIDRELGSDEWQGYADALVALAERKGLKIDSPVTGNAAGIMRAPGSIHHKTGATVKAYRTGSVYRLEELGQLLEHSADATAQSRWGPDALRVNADLGLSRDAKPARCKPFSMLATAEHCAAMRMAISERGAETPYQPWALALLTASLSNEGRELGHLISEGHPDYNVQIVDRKMDSFTGGPPSCDRWHQAWGSQSPCPGCRYGGIGQ